MSIINYLQETKAEMTHVNWPTKHQATFFALVVIVVSVLVSFFLGAFDYLFSRLLNLLIA